MGLFDKWKPKEQQIYFGDNEKEELENTIYNGFERINKAVKPNTIENLEAQGFDLDQASAANKGGLDTDLLPNQGKVPVKWDIPDISEDTDTQKTINKNKVVFNPDAEGSDFLSGLAPLSQAEQEERARRAEAITGVGALGNSLSALANLFAVGQGGAENQVITPVQDPGIQEYLDKGRQQRVQYAQMRQAQKNADEEMKMKQDAAKRKADLDDALNPLKIQLAQGQIDEQQYKTLAEMYGASKAKAAADVEEIKAKYQGSLMQSTIDRNNASTNASNASAANSYSSAQAHQADAAKKRSENTIPFYSETVGQINVDKNKIMNKANLEYVFSKTNESGTKTATNGYGVANKTTDEKLADIGRHMNDPEVIQALRDVQAGNVHKTEVQSGGTGDSSSGSSQSRRQGGSSSDVKSGGTGSWGSSIHRRKNK